MKERRKLYLDLLLIILLGLLSLTWFRGDFLVNPGDTNFSFNPPHDLYRTFFVWDHQQGLGCIDSMASAKIFPYNLLLSLLTFLGVSIYGCQKILFYLIFTLSGLSAYFLVRYLLFPKPHSRIGALLAANFYMINTYLIQLRWGSGYLMGLFSYAFFPLLVFIWLKGRKTRNFRFSLYFALAALLGLPSLTNAAYLVPLIVVCGLDFLIQFSISLKNKRKLIFLLRFSLVTLLVFVFLFSFWIVSQGIPLKENLSILEKSSLQFNQAEVSSSKASILNLFRNLGEWGFWGDYRGDRYCHYSAVYNSFPFLLIGLLIPLFSLSPLLFFKKDNIKGEYYFLFFILIFLAGIWFSKGVHSPFGDIYRWALENVPLFGTLRASLEKFGPVTIIATTALLGYSLSFFLSKIKIRWGRIALTLSLFSLINLYAWPFWTGDVWRGPSKLLAETRFSIPNYYYDMQRYLTDLECQDYRILQLPDNAILVPGIVSLNLNNRLYTGSDPLGRILKTPILYLNSFAFSTSGNMTSNLFQYYSRDLGAFIERINVFAKILNLRTLLLRNDSDNTTYLDIKDPKEIKPLLHSFELEKKVGKFELYKIPDEDFLPCIYSSFTSTIVSDDIKTLVLMAETRYLDGKPVMLLTEQKTEDREQITEKTLKDINSFVFKDSNWQDLAVQVTSHKLQVASQSTKVNIEKSGIYEIYLDVSELEEEMIEFDIKIDGKEMLQVASLRFQVSDGRYLRIGEVELKEGKRDIQVTGHRLQVTGQKELKLVLVNEEERQRAEEIIWKRINQPGTELCYILSKDGKFYVPQRADYILKAKVSPRLVRKLVRKKEMGTEFKLGMEEELKNWSFRPLRVTYDYSVSEDKALVVSAYFDGNEREDEFVHMENRKVKIDLKEYPYFDLIYKIEDSEVQTIEVVAGIDFDKDGEVNEYIRGIYPRPASETWTDFSYELYNKAKRNFPDEEHYDLLHLEIYPHKLWRVDCSNPERKGEYTFWIKGLQFYSYSPEQFFEVIKNALDIEMNSEEEIKKWMVESKHGGFSLKTKGETLAVVKPLTYLELSRAIDNIDLRQFPMIELEYKTQEPDLQNIELVLGLDFNGDTIIDKSVFLDYPPTFENWGEFKIDAYKLVKNSYPNEKKYNLLEIKLRLKTLVGLKEDEPFYLKRLRIYSRSLVSPVDFVFHKPVLEMDGGKYWLYKKFKDVEDLWFEQIINLERAEHHLSMLEDESFKVEWVILEPEARKQKTEDRNEPEITFRKINPTRYEVKVNGAKEPFWLVFSESFHNQWSLYYRQMGNGRQKTEEEIVAEYPELGVKETKHTMRFTPEDIKYLFKKPLGAGHYLVNGYANGWYIEPKELNLSEDFTLVLYFLPQSLFYLGLGISGLTFLCCVGFLGVGFAKKRFQNKMY